MENVGVDVGDIGRRRCDEMTRGEIGQNMHLCLRIVDERRVYDEVGFEGGGRGGDGDGVYHA